MTLVAVLSCCKKIRELSLNLAIVLKYQILFPQWFIKIVQN